MQLGLPESGVMRHVWRCLLLTLRFLVGMANMRPVAHLCLEILKYDGIDHTLSRCRDAGFESRTSRSLAAGLVHASVLVKPSRIAP